MAVFEMTFLNAIKDEVHRHAPLELTTLFLSSTALTGCAGQGDSKRPSVLRLPADWVLVECHILTTVTWTYLGTSPCVNAHRDVKGKESYIAVPACKGSLAEAKDRIG
eukprot:1151243-Pelagomonas_calceolata.AAC.5